MPRSAPRAGPTPTAFATRGHLHAWLEAHHDTERELLVRCYKVHARQHGITYTEALDEALCFGWIDGVRRGVDDDSFSERFTPRRPKSKWSAVNIKRARELEAEGRMQSPGLAAFHARDEQSSTGYSHESRPVELDPSSAKKLKANRRAWTFFQAQPPWYRRTSTFWVMSAKRDETRAKRLNVLIASSEAGTTIPPLTRDTESARKQNPRSRDASS